MKECSAWIEEFKADVYSQSGEDGVIKKILEILPRQDKWCVEFGAWDGRHLSNTRNIIEKDGYSSIFIEGNKKKFDTLQQNYTQYQSVTPINKFVGFTTEDNLDTILEKTSIPIDFDFLSIDIDGNDFHVWKAISRYKPKVICIEYNPTIPTEVRFVQKADSSITQGSSLLSLVELGKSKGYELISVLRLNAFFVRSEYYPLFQIADNRPEVLRQNLDGITYLFSGYDGTIFLQGSMILPWHGIKLEDYQILPKFLRKYPGNYDKIELVMFGLFMKFRNLIYLLKRFLF
jgi:hypothetical protein